MSDKNTVAPTKNAKLLAWVEEIVQLCQPANVHWCDGSEAEYERLCDLMVQKYHTVPSNHDVLRAKIAMYYCLPPMLQPVGLSFKNRA